MYILYIYKGTWKERLKQKFRNGRRGTKITSPDQENQSDQNSDLTVTPATEGVKKKGRASGGMFVVYAVLSQYTVDREINNFVISASHET